MSAIPNIPAHAEFCVRTGLIAICDWQDYELVKTYCWLLKSGKCTSYAVATQIGEDGTQKKVLMHNLIMPPPEGIIVDHKNGNGLDNRRSNLRFATNQQNSFNTPPYRRKGKVSQYKGVHFEKTTKKFKAVIKVNGQIKTLGRYETEELAAEAYNEAAKNAFGDFARLNLMPFEHIKKTYSVPAEIGRRVVVDGKPGIITADRGNYIGVEYDDQPGMVCNCHPTWNVEYLEDK